MRLFDDRILNRFPAGFLVPDKPVIADLIENDKRLVADFGKLRSPAGAAFDGIVRLDPPTTITWLPLLTCQQMLCRTLRNRGARVYSRFMSLET